MPYIVFIKKEESLEYELLGVVNNYEAPDDDIDRKVLEISNSVYRDILLDRSNYSVVSDYEYFDIKKVDLTKYNIAPTPDYIGFIEAILPTEDDQVSNLDKLLESSKNQIARLRVENALLHLLVNPELALKVILVEFNKMLAAELEENKELLEVIGKELNYAFEKYNIPVTFSGTKLIRKPNETSGIEIPTA